MKKEENKDTNKCICSDADTCKCDKKSCKCLSEDKEANTSERKIHKIVVDKDLCIGAGPCVAVAPEAFDLDDEAKAIVLDTWKNHSDDDLLISAQSCPVLAIKLLDKEGNEISY